jgi:3',5'-cyclic AMP phosphodiesterase CpdA
MKLIHLSDLHVGRSNNDENLSILLNRIDEKYKGDVENTKVIVTGDIVNDGERRQYEHVGTLFDAFKVKGYRILPCPGNHDYGNSGIDAKSVNIDNYAKYLKVDINFPVVERIGDCHFIAIDSMDDERDGLDRFGAEGEIGKIQLMELNSNIERIKRDFPNDKIIVYLHHHPFFYGAFGLLRLKDADAFKEVIKNKINILLFGHKHVEKRFNDNTTPDSNKEKKYGINIILASKKSTDIEKGVLSGTKDKPVLRFYEIDTDTYSANPVEVLV